jgi:2-C-methyl-D-erythritol 4-phosphate cytidylyltransferase
LFEVNPRIDAIYIGCIKHCIPELEEMLKRFSVTKVKRIYPGGDSGQDTIYRGLKEIKKDEENAIVLIHDGVRPLVEQKTIDDCIADAREYGSAVTVTAAFETPIISKDGKSVDEMPPRKMVYTAQAPQCFKLKDVLSWHEKERMEEGEKAYRTVVDTCGLAVKNHVKPHLTEGNRGNVKVTTYSDYLTLIANNLANDMKRFLSIKERSK